MFKKVTLSLLLSATAFSASAGISQIMHFQKNDISVFEFVVTKDHSICALSIGVDPMVAFMADKDRNTIMSYVNNRPARKFEYRVDQGMVRQYEKSEYDNAVAEGDFNTTTLDELADGNKFYMRAWPKLKIDEDKQKIYGLMFSKEAVIKFKACIANS